MNIRMLGPQTSASITVRGQVYTGGPGTILDVDTTVAPALAGAGWLRLCESGPTSQRYVTRIRPTHYTPLGTDFLYYDTTLDKLILFDASMTWRDPVTGNAV